MVMAENADPQRKKRKPKRIDGTGAYAEKN